MFQLVCSGPKSFLFVKFLTVHSKLADVSQFLLKVYDLWIVDKTSLQVTIRLVQIPIQILKIGISEEVYAMYPELKDNRVGLGVANIVLEFLESTDRFKFTEDREEIKQKMIAQQKASDKGVSSNTIQVKGNVILAKYFVYIEVYDFAISEDEEIQVSSAEVKQKTTIGLQVRFVDAETGEIITGSGLGEAITVKKASLLDGVDEVKFNQSTIGISTKKSLETAASRVVSKLIKKGVFRR